MKTNYLYKLRSGDELTLRQQIMMVFQLSVPAIMAQLSSIVMQYIDASMVGRLGAVQSASIGLAASTTWLFGGLCMAMVAGFSVQVAQEIGAGDEKTARNIMKMGFLIALGFAVILGTVGAAISGMLPVWLGGGEDIRAGASAYFLVYSMAVPFMQLNHISGGMLQASGNMKLPSILHILMCGLDVVFNTLLIFPTRQVMGITVPGAGLGVTGAALGTALAQVVVSLIMTYMLLFRSPMLKLRRGERFHFSKIHFSRCIKISVPVAMQEVVMGGAQIMSTTIVSPLGTVSIAANSFAITAESLCYMPGYGIGSAAATMIGQSTGAGRKELTRKLGWLVTLLGMAVMTVSGALMYLLAPWMIGLLSTDPEVVELGTTILRIEAFAEPMYAASIVASGVFRGAGDTLSTSLFNFGSMWLVRLPLAAFLSRRIGLKGVWIAMCIELCIRGLLFLIRLAGKGWQKKSEKLRQNA